LKATIASDFAYRYKTPNSKLVSPYFVREYRKVYALAARWLSTAFVESTINQVVSRRFVKKQQMQWTLKGAHLLLQMPQTRTKVLNNDLGHTFKRWYRAFRAA